MESTDPRYLVSLAHSLRREQRFSEALNAARLAAKMELDNAAAWFNVGAALAGLGDAVQSEAAYRQALVLNPKYAEAWSNLGGLLGASGRLDEELSAYRKAIDANPNLAPVWSNYGNALCKAKRYADAEQASRRSIDIDPQFPAAWINLGRALLECNRLPEAREACERAVEVAPGLAQAWAGLANALARLRQFEQAALAYEKSLALQPDDAGVHANLGVTLRRMGNESGGLEHLRRALALEPENDFASWSLSTSLLEAGEFAEGWARYEDRWKRPDAPPQRYAPRGEFQGSGSLLVWGEQGVGDEILFAPLAAQAAAAGHDVTLEADERLVPLYRRSFSRLRIVGRTQPPQLDPSEFECVRALGSLGRWMRPSWDAFPAHRGYLVADHARSAAYRRTLQDRAPEGSLIVGISWRSSNPETTNEKSAPLREWAALLAAPGVCFVSLQYGDVAEECRSASDQFGAQIVRLPEPDAQKDLDGLAALLAACDLVITTSNVTAHLAGAIGRPGWVLLPQRTGRLWYWFHDRSDSPWYPSLTLMPQLRDGDWTGVMQSAGRLLRARVAAAS